MNFIIKLHIKGLQFNRDCSLVRTRETRRLIRQPSDATRVHTRTRYIDSTRFAPLLLLLVTCLKEWVMVLVFFIVEWILPVRLTIATESAIELFRELRNWDSSTSNVSFTSLLKVMLKSIIRLPVLKQKIKTSLGV